MQRNLERRLQADEIGWYGSPRVAALFREIDVASDAGVACEIYLSDAEQELVANFFRRRSGSSATPISI